MLTTTSLVPKFTMSSRIMLDEVVGWFGVVALPSPDDDRTAGYLRQRVRGRWQGLLHVPTEAPRGDETLLSTVSAPVGASASSLRVCVRAQGGLR